MSLSTTAIFCCLDDFAKTFEDWERHHLLPTGRKRRRSGKLCLSEMLFIMVLFHLSPFKDFKHFWHYGVEQKYRDYFGEIPSYGRFVSLMPRLFIPFCVLMHSLTGDQTGIYVADSTKIAVCHNLRISRNRVFADLAKRGKTTTGWFYGFKLHVVINHKGEIMAIKITPGNTDDRAVLDDMTRELEGKVLADKGYILLRLNWPEFSVGTESIYRSALSSRSLHFVGMNDAKISITLSEEERTALEAVCRRRKVEALVWKRARAFLLLDAGEDARTVCRILDIGPTVLTEWKSAFAAMGLSFFGLKDYSPRQGHLSFAQEAELKAHFSNTPPRNADDVCAHILAEYGQSYCSSGAAKLMSRLGFEYRKPQVLPTRAAEAAQEAFIAAYEALMRRLDDDEMVVFSDAVHPTHQSRPAHGWFPKDQKTAIKASSGRKRLNIQGAIDLETFQFTFVEAEKINARTTRQMLEKLELANPSMTAIHVFVDNARYHHAKVLQPWLNAPDRRVKLHFLPPYAPHLNPIERLWGVMQKWVTHNRHYATFNQFADAIMGFFRQTLPDKWHEFRDTVTDNFRVISLRKYKLI